MDTTTNATTDVEVAPSRFNHWHKVYLVHSIYKGRVATIAMLPDQMDNLIEHGFTHSVDADHTIITKEDHAKLCSIAQDAVIELENYRSSHPDKPKRTITKVTIPTAKLTKKDRRTVLDSIQLDVHSLKRKYTKNPKVWKKNGGLLVNRPKPKYPKFPTAKDVI